MAVPYKEDSLRITCFYSPLDNLTARVGLFTDTVCVGRNKILMETYTPGDGPETPIMSYTSGIPVGVGTYFVVCVTPEWSHANGMRSMVLTIMCIILFGWRRISPLKDRFTSE